MSGCPHDHATNGTSDRLVTPLAWLTVPWAVFLVWHYAATVLKVRSVPEFLGLTLLATALVAGVLGVLLAYLERRYGRRMALSTLLVLGGAPAAYLVAASGVTWAAAAALFLLAAAYGYGAAVACRLGIGDDLRSWQGAPLAVAFGFAVLIVLGIAVGVAGWLSRSVVLAVLALGVVLAAPMGRRLIAPGGAAPSALPVAALSWWWGLIVVMLVGLVGAVAPEVRHDALAVHLPIAREFVLHGAIVNMPQNIQSYFPLNAHVLYAMGMVLVPGEGVPKLINFAAGVLACLMAYDLGARLWRPQVGVAAALATASTPLILWVGGTAYVDLMSVLFAVGAMACLVLLAGRPDASRAAAVGMMVGAAAGTKLVSLVAGVPVLAAACLLIVRGSRGRDRAWRALGAIALGAVLTGAVWYGRAWVLTGNPVFPLLNAIFKSPHWAVENTRLNMGLFGAGTGLADLVALPWRMTFSPGRFVEDGNIGPMYLIALPVALLAILRGRVRMWLWGVAAGACLLWFFGAQYLRYLLPAVPLLAVLGAAGLLGDAVPRGARPASALALVLGVAVSAAGWIVSGQIAFPLDAARGAISRANHAAAHVPEYPVAAFARMHLPESARIYGAGDDFAFYYDRYFVPISWLGKVFNQQLPDRVLHARSGKEVQGILRKAGFTHLVLNPNYPVVAQWRSPKGWMAREAFWEEVPRLLFAYREYYLFDLGPGDGAGQSRPADNLLRQAGMAGSPGGNIIQRVAVVPEMLYALEATIRTHGTSPATAQLGIQWFDENGRALDYATWRQVTVGPVWKRYAMACTAPRTARSAQVRLIADQGSEVEFRKAQFYALR